MRHNRLHAVAHNFAESLASGLGFVIGYYPTDVFKEAAANGEQGLVVDFLNGEVLAERCSKDLRRAISKYRDAFPEFCAKHGVEQADFRMFRVRFLKGQLHNPWIVTIEDSDGKSSSREYRGVPGRRVKDKDELGRLRPRRLSEPDTVTLESRAPEISAPETRRSKSWLWFWR